MILGFLFNTVTVSNQIDINHIFLANFWNIEIKWEAQIKVFEIICFPSDYLGILH